MITPVYTLVDLEQGSPEWLAWRHDGLGGSDAALLLTADGRRAVLGKRLQSEPDDGEPNPWMVRGKLLEPEARAKALLSGLADDRAAEDKAEPAKEAKTRKPASPARAT